uniref:Uncharacterized protein n=1 Tax=Ditylenchus dipsaci TaxID=166011 RepID=A0A915EV33_9BILA
MSSTAVLLTRQEPRQRSPLAAQLSNKCDSPRRQRRLLPENSPEKAPVDDEDTSEEAKDVVLEPPTDLRLRKSTTPQLLQRQDSQQQSRKKWTSAFRVVQSITRFKNMPSKSKNLHEQSSMSGSLFGGDRMPNSNESTPSRTIEEPEIDPVYLALKQATGKYGGAGGGNSNAGSRNGSRRGSSAHNFPCSMATAPAPVPRTCPRCRCRTRAMPSQVEVDPIWWAALHSWTNCRRWQGLSTIVQIQMVGWHII